MTFSKEQMEILSEFESFFSDMKNAKTAKYAGKTNLLRIHQIYAEATGDRTPFRISCGRCIGDLYLACGKIYFEDKEEMEKANKPTKLKKRTRKNAV